MSVQLSSWSRSGWKSYGGVLWGGGFQVATVSNLNEVELSCSELSWVTLGFDNKLHNLTYRYSDNITLFGLLTSFLLFSLLVLVLDRTLPSYIFLNVGTVLLYLMIQYSFGTSYVTVLSHHLIITKLVTPPPLYRVSGKTVQTFCQAQLQSTSTSS